jgi:hypothetical protein
MAHQFRGAKNSKSVPRVATCKIRFSTGGERIYWKIDQLHDLVEKGFLSVNLCHIGVSCDKM